MKYVFFVLALMFSVQSFAGTAQNTIDWLESTRSPTWQDEPIYREQITDEFEVNIDGKRYKCTRNFNDEINCRNYY